MSAFQHDSLHLELGSSSPKRWIENEVEDIHKKSQQGIAVIAERIEARAFHLSEEQSMLATVEEEFEKIKRQHAHEESMYHHHRVKYLSSVIRSNKLELEYHRKVTNRAEQLFTVNNLHKRAKIVEEEIEKRNEYWKSLFYENRTAENKCYKYGYEGLITVQTMSMELYENCLAELIQSYEMQSELQEKTIDKVTQLTQDYVKNKETIVREQTQTRISTSALLKKEFEENERIQHLASNVRDLLVKVSKSSTRIFSYHTIHQMSYTILYLMQLTSSEQRCVKSYEKRASE